MAKLSTKETQEKQRLRQHDMENTIRLLSFMAAEFILTSSPAALMNIMTACGYESSSPTFEASWFVVSNKFSLKIIFQDFQTVCIVLEVFFAASDFYLFCWCHDSLRHKVAHFRNQQGEVMSSSGLTSTIKYYL